jgi:hypothetical protein
LGQLGWRKNLVRGKSRWLRKKKRRSEFITRARRGWRRGSGRREICD